MLFTNTNAKIVLLKMNSFMRVTKVFKIVSRDGAGAGGGGGGGLAEHLRWSDIDN